MPVFKEPGCIVHGEQKMTEQEWLTSADPQAMLDIIINGICGNRDIATDRKLRLFACACCRQVWDQLTDDVPCGRCGDGKVPELLYYTGRAQGKPCPDCQGAGRINRSRRAVEVAERYADGEATENDLESANQLMHSPELYPSGPNTLAWMTAVPHSELVQLPPLDTVPPATQAALLRDIFGNPWRPVALPKVVSAGRYEWSPWVTCDVARIAEGIYAARAFERMPILGDALEDAGRMDTKCSACGGSGSCELRPIGNGAWSGACAFCGGTGKIGLLGHCRGPGPHVRGCFVLDIILGFA